MEKHVLGDKDVFPEDEVVFSHIRQTKSLWISLFELIDTDYPDFSREWRYYKDGNSWLMKVTRKTKTICWVSVIEKGFSTTFYFNDRAEEAIQASTISAELKESFINGKRYGKIRGMTIQFKNKKDIEHARTLIDIRLKIK